MEQEDLDATPTRLSRRGFLQRAGLTGVAAAGLYLGGWGSSEAMAATDPETETLHASDWNRILAAAKKEGKVSISSTAGPSSTAIPAAFKKTYGIELEYLVGNTQQLVSRWQSERAAGQYTIDASVVGATTVWDAMLPNKWLDPIKPILILPQDTKGSNWKVGHPWYRDPSNNTVLQIFNTITPLVTVNSKDVGAHEITSLQDLLAPKWKGKICAFTPAIDGGGLAVGSSIYASKGKAFAKKLYQGQNVALSDDYQQVATWVAKGTYPVGLAVTLSYLQPFEKAGLKFGIPNLSDAIPSVGGGFGDVVLWKNAPHPNAAIVFVNWIASKAGVTLAGQLQGQAPARSDINPTWVPKSLVPSPHKKYLDFYSRSFTLKNAVEYKAYYASFLH